MIILKADHRHLVKGMKFAYLDEAYAAGSTTVKVSNTAFFTAANEFALIGEFGQPNSEIIQVTSVTPSAGTIGFNSPGLKRAHGESARVTIIPFNKVKFYWTAADSFATSTPLNSGTAIDVDPTSFFTQFQDTGHSTGYGWFVYFNSASTAVSSNSNAIPYSNFSGNTVKSIVDSFNSLLNQNQLKLVTWDDTLRWLNEAYAVTVQELNFVNSEYTASPRTVISLTPGVYEYALPDRMSDVVSVNWASDGKPLNFRELSSVLDEPEHSKENMTYYLRGNWIGFTPTPDEAADVEITCLMNPDQLSSYYDRVALPDNGWHFLQDYMLYRAANKLNRDGAADYANFERGLARMKVMSVWRTLSPGSFGLGDNQKN